MGGQEMAIVNDTTMKFSILRMGSLVGFDARFDSRSRHPHVGDFYERYSEEFEEVQLPVACLAARNNYRANLFSCWSLITT